MNILLITPFRPDKYKDIEIADGGIGKWTERFLKSDITKKHNVVTVNTVLIGNRLMGGNRVNYLDEVKRTIRIVMDLYRVLKKESIDIAHFNSNLGKLGIIRDYFCLRILKSHHVKVIMNFRCNVPDCVKSSVSMEFFKRILLFSDGVIALNNESKQFIQEHNPVKTNIIPNFMTEVFEQEHTRDIRENIENVLFVGQIRISKGIDVIVEVAKLRPDLNFIVLGARCDDVGMADNVIFVGNVSSEKVREYMLHADLFLFPTHTEGFPNVITEAMSCGLPIISTRVGAIPEMLEEKGGIMVGVNDVPATLNAIKKLEEKEIRTKMSEWNIAKVKTEYNFSVIEDKLLNFYRLIINDKIIEE